MPKKQPIVAMNGKIMRKIRNYAGISQETLADHLGVVKCTVYQWESARRNCSDAWIFLAHDICSKIAQVNHKAKGKVMPDLRAFKTQVG